MGEGIIESRGNGFVASSASASNRRAALSEGLVAFLIYLALSLLFFSRGLIGHFSDRFLGREADPSQMIWLLKWWPYALSHHLNPFLTNYVWAPVGFNFAWMTSIPLPALLAAPLTYTIGLVSTYNILALLSAPSAAICAFALCRRLSGSFWPSMLGGFVFGFSSFMIGQTLGHLCLILSFPVPLAAYLMARRIEDSIAARWFVATMAAVLIAEFLIDMEMFATAVVIGTVSLGLGYRVSQTEIRQRLLKLLLELAGSFAITAFVVSPYLYYFLGFDGLHQPLWPSEKFSTDLLNFIIPTPLNLAGTIPWLDRLTSSFTGTVMERDGFIALPLIAIAVAWGRRHWKEPLCKVLIVSAVIVCTCAMGPYLQIGGVPTIPMPWLAISHLPLLEHAVPDRLMVFPPLAMAVIVSLWMADPQSHREMKALAVVATLVLMIPNLSARFWAATMQTPAFFTDGSAQRYLSRKDIVLTLPWGLTGHSMDWQAECDMCFRNVAGWTGMERFPVRRWPIVNYLAGSRDLPERNLQFGAFLANNGVTKVLVDDADSHAEEWNQLAASTGITAMRISGVSLYEIPRDALSHFEGLTGLEMERRATEIRFDDLLSASAAYFAAGNPLAAISPNRLVDLGFLPATWKRVPHGFYDTIVLPSSTHGVIIGELASPSAIENLIGRYRDRAERIYLPYPRIADGTGNSSSLSRLIHNALLPPAAMPIDGESMRFVGIEFSQIQLRVAIRAPSHSERTGKDHCGTD
jgi:hypothetical protein